MSSRITRAAARNAARSICRRSLDVLGAPGVRLSMTLGTVFCMTGAAAVLLIPNAICAAAYGISEEPPWLMPATWCAAFLLLSPMLAGFMRMAKSAAFTSSAGLWLLFEPYSSPGAWLAACAGMLLVVLRWGMPVLPAVYFAATTGMSWRLWLSIPAALLWMRYARVLSVAAHRLMTDGFGAPRSGGGNIFERTFRQRRIYAAVALRGIPLCLLSVASVLTLFVFHTIPLFAVRTVMTEAGDAAVPNAENDKILSVSTEMI